MKLHLSIIIYSILIVHSKTISLELKTPATLYLSNREVNNVLLTEKNLHLVNNNLSTILIAHGWTETSDKALYLEYMKTSLWHHGDVINYIKVNWTHIALKDYSIAATEGVQLAGYYVGDILVKLNDNGLKLANVQFIGHSLGAHVAGCASKRLQSFNRTLLGRISGLDPAGPLFYPRAKKFCKLGPTDATMVDILHTNAGEAGYPKNLGTVDFYANGGTTQTGCDSLLKDVYELIKAPTSFNMDSIYCSHQKSVLYFNESINSDQFIASGLYGQTIYGQNIPKNTVGTYDFDTNADYPYAMS